MKWNWNLLNFLPFVFIFGQCGHKGSNLFCFLLIAYFCALHSVLYRVSYWQNIQFKIFFGGVCFSFEILNSNYCVIHIQNNLYQLGRSILRFFCNFVSNLGLKLESKELNHFGVIADLFRQGHSSISICAILLFLKTFHYKNDKKCKSISIFFFRNNNNFFLLHEIQTPSINMQNGRQVI